MTSDPSSKARQQRRWPHAAILGALIVALLGCIDLVVQGLLLIRTSVVGGLAVLLAGLAVGFGVLWRIKVKWAQLRGGDSSS